MYVLSKGRSAYLHGHDDSPKNLIMFENWGGKSDKTLVFCCFFSSPRGQKKSQISLNHTQVTVP